MKLDDNYSKTLMAFFSAWQVNLNEHEDTTGKTVDDAIKREWLTASLQEHTMMNMYTGHTETVEQTTETELTFDKWYTMITNYAKVEDSKRASKLTKLKVNQTQTGSPNGGRGNDHGNSQGGRGRGGG